MQFSCSAAAAIALLLTGADVVQAQEGVVPARGARPINERPDDVERATTEALRQGDTVALNIIGFPELSGTQAVTSDGYLQLPLAGPIAIVGLTPSEAALVIADAMRPYVRRPQVGLSIVERSPLRVSVIGEVINPGPYSVVLNDLSEEQQFTLTDALVLAGGLTPSADILAVTIRRSRAPQALAAPLRGDETELSVNLWDVLLQGDLDADPVILNGDEIIVSSTSNTASNEQVLLSSTLAPEEITVHVGGEVRSPGATAVDPEVNVSEAVAAAGGPTTDANLNRIVLYRVGDDGDMEEETFEFGQRSGPLRQGDVILVGASSRSNTTNLFEFLGTMLSPVSALLNIFGN
ncbi:MAG: polysaccharide biosynthesis/export family protein [Elainellaceae cyanobacterium]